MLTRSGSVQAHGSEVTWRKSVIFVVSCGARVSAYELGIYIDVIGGKLRVVDIMRPVN